MPNPETESVEQFVFAGPIGAGGMIALGLTAAAVLVVLAWLDRRAGRTWTIPLLFVLRLAALIVVLWVLAGPEIMTITRHFRAKTAIIMIDHSASMGVTDPVSDDGSHRRWQAAGAGRSGLMVQLDSTAAELAVAASRFGRFVRASRTASQASGAVQRAEQCRLALAAAKDRIEAILDRRPAKAGNPHRQLSQLRDELVAVALPAVTQARDDFSTGRLQLAGDSSERLAKVGRQLAGLARSAADLADAHAASAADAGQPAEATRSEKVAKTLGGALSSWLDDIDEQGNVIAYRFGTRVFPVGLAELPVPLAVPADPAGGKAGATNLSAALQQIARDGASEPLELVIWLTDGGHNHGADPLKTAAALTGVQTIIVPIGSTRRHRDVILHHAKAPRTAFLKDQIVISVTIDAHGCEGEDATVELLAGEDVIDSQTLAITAESFVRQVTFRQPARQPGPHKYLLRAAALPEEEHADNNSAEVQVEVIEDKIRVLVADNLPRWEFRYLVNLFKRDKRIVYEAVQIEPRDERGRPALGAGLPQTLDQWSRFRVVILGDLRVDELDATRQGQLKRYVNERGGTLILIAGPGAMPQAYMDGPLGALIPVKNTPAAGWQTFTRTSLRLHLTAEGQGMPALQLAGDPLASARLWRGLADKTPLYAMSGYCEPKPTSHVLIAAAPSDADADDDRAVNRAMLSWQPYGRGRVVYLSAPSTYLLRFRQGDRYHHRFWAQLLRWAISRDLAGGSKTVRLATDKSRYACNDDVAVTVRLANLDQTPLAEAEAQIVARQGESVVATVPLKPDRLEPGMYRAVLKALPAGQIRLRVAGEAVDSLLAQEGRDEPVETVVGMDPPAAVELRNTRCNLPLLKQIAETCGGVVLPPTGLAAAAELADMSPEVSESVARRPLWDRWAFLWIFVGCLCVEWVTRKLTGMA